MCVSSCVFQLGYLKHKFLISFMLSCLLPIWSERLALDPISIIFRVFYVCELMCTWSLKPLNPHSWFYSCWFHVWVSDPRGYLSAQFLNFSGFMMFDSLCVFELGYLIPQFQILFMLIWCLAIGSKSLPLGRIFGIFNVYYVCKLVCVSIRLPYTKIPDFMHFEFMFAYRIREATSRPNFWNFQCLLCV